MSRPSAANWVAESTTTTGTGDVTPAGALEGFAPFSVMTDGLIYYTLQDGLDKECGIGTLGAGKIQRTTVLASFINGTYASPGAKIDLSGYAEIYCTVNADLFNQMNAALTKLDGIEDGATADQIAVEVPFTPNFLISNTNTQAAIDALSNDVLIYPAAAIFNDTVGSFIRLANNITFVNGKYFVNPTDMSIYVAAALHSGTIASFSSTGPDQVTIVTGTEAIIANRTKIATQDWVTSRESKVIAFNGDTDLTLDTSTALTFDITLTQPTIQISFLLATEAAGTQHETILFLHQGAGANKVTFPANVKWSYDSNPVLSFNAGQVDVFSFIKKAGDSNWYGSSIGGSYA